MCSVFCFKIVRRGYYYIKNLFNTFKDHNDESYVIMYKTYVRPILE